MVFISIRSTLILVILLLSLSGQILSQDTVRKAEPPIIEIELSGTEPLPAGVAKLMGFGSPAGGGGYFDPQNPERPRWVWTPSLIEYPRISRDDEGFEINGSYFEACGYPGAQPPKITLIEPSGNQITIDIAVNDIGCWTYSLDWAYGMELGGYALIADHPLGRLSHKWTIDYPRIPTVGLISDPNENEDLQVRLLMGFPPKERLTLRIYSESVDPNLLPNEYPSDYGVSGYFGGYVATRTIETDANGTAILEFKTTASAPFRAARLGFTIDGYDRPPHGGGLPGPEVRDYHTSKSSSTEEVVPPFAVSQPYIDDGTSSYLSIWKGLNFNDMKSPGSQNYRTSLRRNEEYRLVFTWCADTVQRLYDILLPLTLTLSINDSPISEWDLVYYDDETCRFWQTLLKSNSSELKIEFHYHLSEDIFDGTSTYKAGDYYHIINATFQ